MSLLTVNIAKIIPISESNGPGSHFTIWFQGCNLNCLECFNPHTHDKSNGEKYLVSEVIHQILPLFASHRIRGVTITGGEPFQQRDGLLHLVKEIRKLGDIGIIVLTGYNEHELSSIPEFNQISLLTDVIIAGRFVNSLKIQKGIRGSQNKQYLLQTDFYTLDEFDSIPEIEIITFDDGSLSITGINPDLLSDLS